MAFTASFLQIFFLVGYLVLPLLVFLSVLVVVLGQVVSYLERWGKFDGLYWSLITATTVGYGDIRPLKKVSKALSVLIAVIGMMFTGIIIAITLNAATITLEKYADQRVIEKIRSELE